MTSTVELEAYHPGRRDDYLRLMREAWGEGTLDGPTFDWWFDGAPDGSVRSVAVRDGEVVAVAGHTFTRILVGGVERTAQFTVHAVTAPSARGLGLFRALELRHEEQGADRGSVGVLAFASAPTRPLFLGPLGWTAIGRRRVWARPLAGLARRVPGLGRGRDTGRRLPPGVRQVERFDAAAEAVYRRVAPRLGAHVVRDLRHLDWRYAASPRDYRLLQADDGFAVVGRRRHRGLETALVLELVGGSEAVRSLLRAAVAVAADAEVLMVVPSVLAPPALLVRHGVVPSPVTLDVMARPFGDELPLAADAWTLSLGDTDFF